MTHSPSSMRVACADLNGQMRGKRLPISAVGEVEFVGARLALSALAIDVLGKPVSVAPTGDGQLRRTDRGAVPMPWLDLPSSLVPMWMYSDEGRPDPRCPRHGLARIVGRWMRHGWSPQVAPTIEVTLIDEGGSSPAPATPGPRGSTQAEGQLASLVNLDGFNGFLDALFSGATAMGLTIDEAETGASLAQFRLRLAAAPAMRAADDLWLLKALIQGTAQAQGFTACFLAKPFADQPGNGMHLRFWPVGSDGKNLFDNGLKTGSHWMRQAVAGCLSFLPGATLIFAPFGSSYGRFESESLAPTSASWGYENRTTALRIPAGDPANCAIQHRAPGADANPYLAIAAALGGALAGIEDDLTPPDPVIGNAYTQRVLQFPMDCDSAIERFANSPRMARLFTPELIETFAALKQQEQSRLHRLSTEETLTTLLYAV